MGKLLKEFSSSCWLLNYFPEVVVAFESSVGVRRYPTITIDKDPCAISRSRAISLSATLHEWPLPEDEFKKQAVIFELQCPADYVAYRGTTYMLMVDVF